MDKWTETTIGDVLKRIQTGTTPKKNVRKYYENASVNWYSPSDFNDNTKYLKEAANKISEIAVKEKKARIYMPNTVLLVGIGTVGRVGLLKEEASSNQQITGLVFHDKVYGEYAYYWIRYIRKTIEAYSSNAVLSIINQKAIRSLPFKYPKSLNEQRRIVSKLDTLFSEIDASLALIDQNIEQAEALKLSVLEEEINFQNFEAVLFLKHITERKEKLTPKPNVVYNIVGLENIEPYSGRLINFKPLRGEESRSNKSVFKTSDVLYSKLRPYLNKVLVAEFDGIATTEILPFKVDSNKFINQFVAYFLRSESIVQLINLSCSGARMPRVKSVLWKSLEIPMPPLAAQQKIVNKLDSVFAEVDGLVNDYKQKREGLEALKASLLDSAFKGKL